MATSLSDETPLERPVEIERRLGRWNIEMPVHLEPGDGSSAATIRNISACGMFVAVPRAFEVGDRVLLRLPAPNGGEPVEIRAEVRWSRAAADGAQRPAGVGLRFIEPIWEVVTFVGVVLRMAARRMDVV